MAEHPINRREFLQHLVRGVAAAALVLGAGVLTARPRGETPCTGDGLCDGCGTLAGCRLPQALSARAARRGGEHGR